MAGRRPKPSSIRDLEGNPGHRAPNKNEPKPPVLTKISPPDWLPEKAQEFCHEVAPLLVGMRVLTDADVPAFLLLCDAYAEWRAARAVIDEHGATYESISKMGFMIRARPEVAIAAEAWRRVKSMLVEFGMTPAARSRIVAAGKEKASDVWSDLANE